MKTENKIDLKDSLKYALLPVRLSLCHADGKERSCKKAGIYNVIESCATTPKSAYSNVKTYIFDVMAVIRCVLYEYFKHIKELIFKILNTIPESCYMVDVVAGSYRTVSWTIKTKDA